MAAVVIIIELTYIPAGLILLKRLRCRFGRETQRMSCKLKDDPGRTGMPNGFIRLS